jgi:hypothetical protein
VAVARTQHRVGEKALTLPTLIDLLREHRSIELTRARKFAAEELPAFDVVPRGLAALPVEDRDRLQHLMWFYDQLGVLVAHDVIDADAVIGYLGGSVLWVWEAVRPLVEAERARRRTEGDPGRYQEYFENFTWIVRERGSERARYEAPRWRKPIA